MMSKHVPSMRPLVVALSGDTTHAEFAAAIDLLRATTHVVPASQAASADLVVHSQPRPGMMPPREVASLQRVAPLAGQVALLGTWCEGEPRTGRPEPGVERVYWYDFPTWWQAQLALWTAGRCPEWARADDDRRGGSPRPSRALGRIAIEATCWETAAALSDVLRDAGYATTTSIESTGIVAGIWEGRQLDGYVVKRLEDFCRRLRSPGAPTIALLDFPRSDRCKLARQLGVADVIGKPWRNELLVRSLSGAIRDAVSKKISHAA